MSRINSLCVYCGSSTGLDPRHAKTAVALGKLMARENITLVYGGGRVGLMGVVADAILDADGKAIGIIPTMLKTVELAHAGLTELIAVDTMHARKHRMFEIADAFAILPGGLGTLDEAFEIITWRQLGLHDKPILLIDSGGYWRPFRDLLAHVIEGGFARPETERLVTPVEDVGQIPAILANLPGPSLPQRPDRL
jgi:uncharacterized protein (TIGR00730 family)